MSSPWPGHSRLQTGTPPGPFRPRMTSSASPKDGTATDRPVCGAQEATRLHSCQPPLTKIWEHRGDQPPDRHASNDRGQQLPGDGQRPDGNNTRCSHRRANTSMARLLTVVHGGEVPNPAHSVRQSRRHCSVQPSTCWAKLKAQFTTSTNTLHCRSSARRTSSVLPLTDARAFTGVRPRDRGRSRFSH